MRLPLLDLTQDAVARDPTTPPDHLKGLPAQHQRAVAANPNTSFEHLLDLLHRYPDEVLANPNFRLAIASQPQRFTRPTPDHAHQLARYLRLDTPIPAALRALLFASDEAILAETLLHRQDLTPHEAHLITDAYLQRTADLPAGDRRASEWGFLPSTLLWTRALPLDDARNLTRNLTRDTLHHAAQHQPNTTPQALRAIAELGDAYLNTAVVEHTNADPELLEYLADRADRATAQRAIDRLHALP